MINESRTLGSTIWCIVRFACVLAVAGVSIGLPAPVLAHTITVDGATGDDWCYPSVYVADTRSVQNCGAGNEVWWTDGMNDTTSGLGNRDVLYFATTADANNLYLMLLMVASDVTDHVQIAIDVDGTTSGTTTWYDPLNALGPVGVMASPTMSPDYIITISHRGTPSATLLESVTTGSWLPLGSITNAGGLGSPQIEIAIPWTDFSVLPFSPGTPAGGVDITIMTTQESSSNMPTGPVEDVISEPMAGTYTSTPTSCTSGTGASACELGDTCADAFVHVTYNAPSAVGVVNAGAAGAGLWMVAGSVATLAGVVLLRKPNRRHR